MWGQHRAIVSASIYLETSMTELAAPTFNILTNPSVRDLAVAGVAMEEALTATLIATATASKIACALTLSVGFGRS